MTRDELITELAKAQNDLSSSFARFNVTIEEGLREGEPEIDLDEYQVVRDAHRRLADAWLKVRMIELESPDGTIVSSPPKTERRVAPAGGSCCSLRKKIALSVVAVLPEAICGVSDADLADVTIFDERMSPKPIISLRYCPWCGALRTPATETTVITPADEDKEGEEWKDGAHPTSDS